jgi:hypothetical protein
VKLAGQGRAVLAADRLDRLSFHAAPATMRRRVRI